MAKFETSTVSRKLKQKHGETAITIVAMTDVLRAGWELDAEAVIYDLHGKRKFATTDHGQLVEMDLDAGRAFLRKRTKEYEKVMCATKAMIDLTDA